MNTMTTSSAPAVSRFLKSKGFERYNGEIGFQAYYQEDGASPIVVLHRHYNNGHASNIAEELEAAGYVIDTNTTNVSFRDANIMATVLVIAGKVAA